MHTFKRNEFRLLRFEKQIRRALKSEQPELSSLICLEVVFLQNFVTFFSFSEPSKIKFNLCGEKLKDNIKKLRYKFK